jgi:hypothetical protein
LYREGQYHCVDPINGKACAIPDLFCEQGIYKFDLTVFIINKETLEGDSGWQRQISWRVKNKQSLWGYQKRVGKKHTPCRGHSRPTQDHPKPQRFSSLCRVLRVMPRRRQKLHCVKR